jgi:hypothetical protein
MHLLLRTTKVNKYTFFNTAPNQAEAETVVTDEIHIKMPGGRDAGKTNTALLLDQHGHFVAFGSGALDAYFENNHDETDLLFERFKMRLAGGQDDVQTDAIALNGQYSN